MTYKTTSHNFTNSKSLPQSLKVLHALWFYIVEAHEGGDARRVGRNKREKEKKEMRSKIS